MKAKHIFLIAMLIAFPFFGRAKGDKSITPESVRMLVVESPDSVLSILDRVERDTKSGWAPYQISLLRGLAYNEKRMFSLVERYAIETLEADSIDSHENLKLNALTLLAGARNYYGNYQGSIETLTKAIELARKLGNEPAEWNILTTMAKTSFSMGNRKQGYGYLDRIINSAEESTDVRSLANVSSALGVKIVELYADDKFADGLKEGKKRLDVIDRIDKIGGAPEGFTDQQRAYAYARIASCAERLGEKAEARDAYKAFMKTDYAQAPLGRAYIMDYLLDSENWQKVLEFTRPLYPILSEGDTINDDYRSLLVSNARAYAGLGDFRLAYALSNRANAIGDSLTNRENTRMARELATMFALNEKDIELVNVKASMQRKHVIMVAAIIAVTLLVIILGLMIRAYRISRRQQKLTTRRIDELLKADKEASDEPTEPDEDYRHFLELQRKIVDGRLFRESNFNRESMMRLTGLTRMKIVNMIEKYTGLTPVEYVNKLRVEYSVKLIQEHPAWTIDAVAEECGYSRRGTYYSHFNKIYGITPAQYRKEKQKQNQQI